MGEKGVAANIVFTEAELKSLADAAACQRFHHLAALCWLAAGDVTKAATSELLSLSDPDRGAA